MQSVADEAGEEGVCDEEGGCNEIGEMRRGGFELFPHLCDAAGSDV